MNFSDLNLNRFLLDALNEMGFTTPTPIQKKAFPEIMSGKDVVGIAQTGTGKTAAFTIPIIQHLYNNSQHQKGRRTIKALIVTPTRELAIQINDNIRLPVLDVTNELASRIMKR